MRCISSLGIGRVWSQLGVSLTRFSLWGTFSTTLWSQVYEPEWCMYKIKYESLDNGAARNEFIHTHEKFHGWKCEEAVIFSASDTIRFVKIIKMFNICVQGSISSIALAQEYCLVSPSEYVENDWIIGFPLLWLEPPQCTFFVPTSAKSVMGLLRLLTHGLIWRLSSAVTTPSNLHNSFSVLVTT